MSVGTHAAFPLTPAAQEHYQRLEPLPDALLKGLLERDRQLFELRLKRYFQNLFDGLEPLYGQRDDFGELLARLVSSLAAACRERPEELKLLDLERELEPDWFQSETMVGYVCYVERFAGTLAGVAEHLDYFAELGVTYLHLMSCLKPREGENDGGYAIADYCEVDPKLGTMSELRRLCRELRGRGISLCLDLVLNHCAKEHPWAVRARAGETRYQEYFYTFDDRELPDAYERTLPEIFPTFAPGNFSYCPEMGKWAWTTFHSYQWDLNWSNPEVFLEILETLLYLANQGVEVFRLDAVAFLWKRLGTDCQNQPEVQDILQALRACSRIVCPAVAHKAEAIVSPRDLICYFGTGGHYGKVANIAYHNTLMVQFWSALASRDTRLMAHTLRSFPRTPSSIAWGLYIRCHDDIGWAVTEEDAAAVGLSGPAHREFLSAYYAGEFPGSHARGAVFQFNSATGDKRISGTFASLAGLEQALKSGDEQLITLSIERILLGMALICGFGGLPLLYMGDELGLLNDYDYATDPRHEGDNRWLHRPFMNWDVAALRHRPGTVEARIFQGVQKIVRARKRTPHFHAQYETVVLDSPPALFAYVRPHPLGDLLAVYNFSEAPQWLSAELLGQCQLPQPFDQLEQRFVPISQGALQLGPYQRLWLV
jgi:amylosucrase